MATPSWLCLAMSLCSGQRAVNRNNRRKSNTCTGTLSLLSFILLVSSVILLLLILHSSLQQYCDNRLMTLILWSWIARPGCSCIFARILARKPFVEQKLWTTELWWIRLDSTLAASRDTWNTQIWWLTYDLSWRGEKKDDIRGLL